VHTIQALTAAPLLRVAVLAVVLLALAKWGHAPVWEFLLTLALGVVAYRTVTGPDIGQILSQFRH
jgi:hypothetical protein